MPLSKDRKSFVEWIKLPYYRFPGFSQIKNNDVVVFNYPEGDTVSTVFQSNISYYRLINEAGRDNVLRNPRKFGNIIYRPVDKRENYIKRCIGIPGDSLQIINQDVFINGKKLAFPMDGQFKYIVDAPKGINEEFRDEIDISDEDYDIWRRDQFHELPLSEYAAQELKKRPSINNVDRSIEKAGSWSPYLFPFDSLYPWNVDNFGPIYIPKKGATVQLTMQNISLYKRIIQTYEGNDLDISGGNIMINGKPATSYTFNMDYYWMMGDNRHNSADSRFWGFVPEDHIVGKASFVWLSLDPEKSWLEGKIRWNKLFRVIK